jgi:hypothetical protein
MVLGSRTDLLTRSFGLLSLVLLFIFHQRFACGQRTDLL